MNVFEGIKSSYIAEGLTDGEIQAIVGIAEEATFEGETQILREFSEAHNVYILLIGKVRVETGTGDLIARLGPGTILGELALFDTGERSANVVADGTATLARIKADDFNALMDRQPHLGLTVLRHVGKVLCQRLRSSNIQLEAVLGNLGF